MDLTVKLWNMICTLVWITTFTQDLSEKSPCSNCYKASLSVLAIEGLLVAAFNRAQVKITSILSTLASALIFCLGSVCNVCLDFMNIGVKHVIPAYSSFVTSVKLRFTYSEAVRRFGGAAVSRSKRSDETALSRQQRDLI